MEECCHLDVTQCNFTGGIISWWHRQADHQYAKQPEYQRWTFLATLALQSHSHEQLLVARLHTQEVKCFELKSVKIQ